MYGAFRMDLRVKAIGSCPVGFCPGVHVGLTADDVSVSDRMAYDSLSFVCLNQKTTSPYLPEITVQPMSTIKNNRTHQTLPVCRTLNQTADVQRAV